MTERKTDMNITKTDKYKNLNNDSIMEHKTKMNITKIGKYKNLNLMQHKTDTNITKIEKYRKTEQHFCCGIQNYYEYY